MKTTGESSIPKFLFLVFLGHPNGHLQFWLIARSGSSCWRRCRQGCVPWSQVASVGWCMKIFAGSRYNVWKWDILIIYLKIVPPCCSSLPCCRGGNTIYIFQILCISRRSHRTVHLRLVVSTEEEKDVPTDGRGGHRLVAHLEHCRHPSIVL